jgi:hypothetical protein
LRLTRAVSSSLSVRLVYDPPITTYLTRATRQPSLQRYERADREAFRKDQAHRSPSPYIQGHREVHGHVLHRIRPLRPYGDVLEEVPPLSLPRPQEEGGQEDQRRAEVRFHSRIHFPPLSQFRKTTIREMKTHTNSILQRRRWRQQRSPQNEDRSEERETA